MTRPAWNEYFMKITEDVAERATCVKRKVGAIIVMGRPSPRDRIERSAQRIFPLHRKELLRKKMNVPSGQRHELCRGLHAEQNAIIQAAVHGVKIEGGTMYCTYQPCVICVKMMINAGIKKLVYAGGYPDELAAEMLKESKIKVVKLMKVGYLGREGTFSEEAGKEYGRKLEGKVEMFPYPTFHDLLLAADKGKIDEAMAPIENSFEGTIGPVSDMLARDVNLKIRQEIVLPVSNYLLAPKGTRIGR